MKKPLDSVATSSKIKFDEIEEHKSSSEDEGEIERELVDVTFEELLKARSNGSHTVYRKPNPEKQSGRANKNRPMEVSAKKLVSRFREVIQVPKKVVRDPRFETLCGNLDMEGFKKRYNFLYENGLPAEREKLKRSVKESNDPTVIDELKNRISEILKFVSKSLLRNTRSSRHLASSNPIWRKGGGRMLRRTTDMCHIDAPELMTNKTTDITCFMFLTYVSQLCW